MALRHALLVLVACSHAKPAGLDGDVAIVDVTVVAMDREGETPHQTVVLRGDRIAAIAPASARLADRVKTIDGRGKYLLPGLADMHVHTFDPRQLALFATEGVTTIRVMWGSPASVGLRDAIAKENSAAPRLAPSIATAGSIIDGEPPVWPGSTGVSTPEQATAEVEAQKRAGYDFIKVYAKLSPEAYKAIVGTAARLGMRVIGHVPFAVGLGGVLDAKQSSIEHLDGYVWFAKRDDAQVEQDFKGRMRAWQFTDPAKLATAIARTKAAGTWNCPTLIVLDRLSNMDRPATLERPENRFVAPGQREQWDPKKDFRMMSWSADDFAAARASTAWNKKLVKQLSDAGVGLLAGTDVGNPWLVPGFSLHEELGLLVQSGLTPYQALRAATAAPADYLKSDAGTIAVGRRADLVLVDADPLADIHNTTKIAGVALRGRWLDAKALHDEQDRIAKIFAGNGSRFATPPRGMRFRYTSGQSGEEAIEINGNRWTSEVRVDGMVDQHFEVTPDSIHVTSDGLDVTMMRAKDKVRVTGTAAHDKVMIEEPLAADELLGGEPAAADAIFMRSLQSLPIGQITTVKLVVLGTFPKLALSRFPVQVKRVADGTAKIGDKTIATHEFVVSMQMGTATISTDEAGWPVTTQSATRL